MFAKFFSIFLLIAIVSAENLEEWTTYNGHRVLISKYFDVNSEAKSWCETKNMELISIENPEVKEIFDEIMQLNYVQKSWARIGDEEPKVFGNRAYAGRDLQMPAVICVPNSLGLLNAAIDATVPVSK